MKLKVHKRNNTTTNNVCKKIITLLTLALFVNAKAQIITTVVGNGTAGYSVSLGQATVAELHNPSKVACDAVGNIYISDYLNNLIRKVNTAGIISIVVGDTAGFHTTGNGGFSGDGGQATVAKLNNPFAVSVDALGNIFIVDQSNERVRMVNSAGIINTIAGNGINNYSGDGGPATASALSDPIAVATDLTGNIYITTNGDGRIRKVSTSGIITTFAGNGTGGFSGDGGQATNAELNQPFAVVVDNVGNLYFTDSNNFRVRKVSILGIITTFAGNGTDGFSGDGGQATNAEIGGSTGLAFDAAGNLYIADQENARIRMINTAGIINTIVGNGTQGYGGDGGVAISAELYDPSGVAFDGAGNLYIADQVNQRIRMVTNVGQTTGIERLRMQNDEFRIYPNPTTSILNVQLTGNNSATGIEVTDVLGNILIHNSEIINQKCALDVSSLPAGVYFVRVGTATQKIIKQ